MLDHYFTPRSIALVGASEKEKSIGRAIFQNIIDSGFNGKIYPVNPKYKQLLNKDCYTSVLDIKEDVDLVVISTPARTVPAILKQSGEKGIRSAIVFSGGFKEVGEKGQALYNELLAVSKKYNIRILGPNCFGVISPVNRLNISFSAQTIFPGKIAVISQSGAICVAILDWALEQNVGFSHFISIGSTADISYEHLIDFLGKDENTESILVYMESLTDARKFLSAARAFARNKPIIVLKTGKSREGAMATMSHTGMLAGNDEVYDAAFRRVGIIRVHTIQELFDCAQALSMQGMPPGDRVAIVTNAGGPGILATDHLVMNNGVLAHLSGETIKELDAHLPAIWSRSNPVDITGNFTVQSYKQAMQACINDDNVDALIVVYVPTATADASEIANEVGKINERTDKTVMAVWMGEKEVLAARDLLEKLKVPVYRFPESAIQTFLKIRQYATHIAAIYKAPGHSSITTENRRQEASDIIEQAYNSGRRQLSEVETKRLLSCYGFPVLPFELVSSKDELREVCKSISFPIVMKIVSPEIMHKTEVGGVRVNIRSLAEAEEMYDEIMFGAAQVPSANIQGILVESMSNHKYELIIGSKKDPVFGPVMIFGRGGTEVEVYKDYDMAIPPVDMGIAKRMVQSTRVYNVLKGFRGNPPVDLEHVYGLLTQFSRLLEDHPSILEFDINPLQADANGMAVLDAKVLLEPNLQNANETVTHFAIAPAPRSWNKEVELKSGLSILIRAIIAEDEAKEYKMIRHISRTSLYYRFFGYRPEITHDFISRFTNIDYDREMAFVAEHTDELNHKRLLGVVRVVYDEVDNHGELAIIVADPWHRMGIASALMNHILDFARSKEMPYVSIYFLESNHNLKHMLEGFGFTINLSQQGIYRGVLDI